MKLSSKVEVRLVLRAVAHILGKGKQSASGTTYRGINVVSDYDGYNIVVSNQYASITVMFHNTFSTEYRSSALFSDFYEQLKAIAREPH